MCPLRSWDHNRHGKITTEDWEQIKAGDARADNVLVAVKPGGRGDISETHVARKYRRARPYVPSPLLGSQPPRQDYHRGLGANQSRGRARGQRARRRKTGRPGGYFRNARREEISPRSSLCALSAPGITTATARLPPRIGSKSKPGTRARTTCSSP